MDRLERIRGCLLAGAAGDALGYQVEFMLLPQILQRHGAHGVRTMAPWISDDTQMTLFTAEGMLLGMKHGMPMPDCVYQSYLNWYRTQERHGKVSCFRTESQLMRVSELYSREAPGNTCLSALCSGKMGTIAEPVNQSKGCGGVMRTAPCGMLRMSDLPEDEDAYARQGAMAAAITHGHILGYVPSAMLADIVHMILREDGRSLETIVLDSLKRALRLFGRPVNAAEGCEAGDDLSDGSFAALLDYADLIRRAVKLASADVPDGDAIRSLGQGWKGDEALAIAVFCALRYQDDLAECLSVAVTHDGDSDSTGAIAGNIVGAWLGAGAIPADWLDAIELRDVVDEMAQKIWAAGN